MEPAKDRANLQNTSAAIDEESGLYPGTEQHRGLKTELSDLVEEFRFMIRGFSGMGASSPSFLSSRKSRIESLGLVLSKVTTRQPRLPRNTHRATHRQAEKMAFHKRQRPRRLPAQVQKHCLII